jgi:phosphopantothenoylcysteine decarboxylase/phosphopantothenate--cysteine ligase
MKMAFEMEHISGRTIIFGVTGGIAAYKAAGIVSRLKALGADVHVIMTRNATKFITPLTFRVLSGNPVAIDMFDPSHPHGTEHISLADMADIVVVAPATANIIGKVANGIADDLLSTVIMATRAPVLFAPAMNVHMYENPIVQGNIEKLKGYGYSFVGPEEGPLACGYEGRGRLAREEEIIKAIAEILAKRFNG